MMRFGVSIDLREDIMYWIDKFNVLRDTITIDKNNWDNTVNYMDLFIFKLTHFIWMANYWLLYIKKKPTSSYTFLFALFIKVTPSRILFRVNWNAMSDRIRKRRTSSNLKLGST